MRETIAAVVASLAFSVLSGADALSPPAKPCRDAPRLTPSGQQSQAPVFQDLAKSGKKCWIGEDHYFTWEFDKTPKMGTSILIVKLYDKDGTRVTDLSVSGRSDMPAMLGAHDSGDIPFKNNKAGDYLLPVNVVMPGDWEILLNFSLDGSVIFRGRIAFHV